MYKVYFVYFNFEKVMFEIGAFKIKKGRGIVYRNLFIKSEPSEKVTQLSVAAIWPLLLMIRLFTQLVLSNTNPMVSKFLCFISVWLSFLDKGFTFFWDGWHDMLSKLIKPHHEAIIALDA